MNGVLAKPFTKEGMWKSVRTNLSHLMKNPPTESEMNSGAGYFVGTPYLNTSTSIKFESPTPPSNSAGNTWSPGQLQQPSLGTGMDQSYGLLNGSGQYSMATAQRQTYPTTMHSAESSSGRLSDVESPPEKRQRLNPQANYSCQ